MQRRVAPPAVPQNVILVLTGRMNIVLERDEIRISGPSFVERQLRSDTLQFRSRVKKNSESVFPRERVYSLENYNVIGVTLSQEVMLCIMSSAMRKMARVSPSITLFARLGSHITFAAPYAELVFRIQRDGASTINGLSADTKATVCDPPVFDSIDISISRDCSICPLFPNQYLYTKRLIVRCGNECVVTGLCSLEACYYHCLKNGRCVVRSLNGKVNPIKQSNSEVQETIEIESIENDLEAESWNILLETGK